MTTNELASLCIELYNLPPRQSIIKAKQDNLISQTQAMDCLQLYPIDPVIEEVKPKPKYRLMDLRELICPWEGKAFKDLTNEQLDANVDAYDDVLKAQALAYLEMRGFK